MKYLLLLSFVLALIPGEIVGEQRTPKTKDFIATVDLIQGIVSADSAKKFDFESEDPHPAKSNETARPDTSESAFFYISSEIRGSSFSYYAIRAPPLA